MTTPWLREEIIGDCRLLLGDCLDILPTLGKADAVVTDIPYEISQKSGGLRELDYGGWDGVGSSDIAFKALSYCKEVPSVVVFSGWHQTTHLCDLFDGRSSRLLAWVKTNPTVMNGQHMFLPGVETAYYGKLPGAWFGGNCVSSVWRGPAPLDREHPTQKPLELMKWCVINTVAPGAVCLDPFMGSGTTLVACAKLGRRGIGIEIDEGYFDIACDRIRKAYAQPDFFVDQPREKPVQEPLFGEAS